jgi:hypothetical protein
MASSKQSEVKHSDVWMRMEALSFGNLDSLVKILIHEIGHAYYDWVLSAKVKEYWVETFAHAYRGGENQEKFAKWLPKEREKRWKETEKNREADAKSREMEKEGIYTTRGGYRVYDRSKDPIDNWEKEEKSRELWKKTPQGERSTTDYGGDTSWSGPGIEDFAETFTLYAMDKPIKHEGLRQRFYKTIGKMKLESAKAKGKKRLLEAATKREGTVEKMIEGVLSGLSPRKVLE